MQASRPCRCSRDSCTTTEDLGGLKSAKYDPCYDGDVKLVTAQVVEGRIEVPPEIADGARVAILAPDDGEPFELSPEDEVELSQALAEIRAGRYVDGWRLLDEIKAKSWT